MLWAINGVLTFESLLKIIRLDLPVYVFALSKEKAWRISRPYDLVGRRESNNVINALFLNVLMFNYFDNTAKNTVMQMFFGLILS